MKKKNLLIVDGNLRADEQAEVISHLREVRPLGLAAVSLSEVFDSLELPGKQTVNSGPFLHSA